MASGWIGSKPISRTGAFVISASSDHASICAPKQTPRYGTPVSTASRVSSRTSLMNGCSSACSTLKELPNTTTPATSSSDGFGASGSSAFHSIDRAAGRLDGSGTHAERLVGLASDEQDGLGLRGIHGIECGTAAGGAAPPRGPGATVEP